MKPRAVQTVKQVAGRWTTVRYVDCPDHAGAKGKPQRSSEFLGPVHDGWEFRCKENAKHLSHRIVALAPKSYPKTPAEAALWMQTEVARQVMKPTKSQS
jgi:hypothetical protein